MTTLTNATDDELFDMLLEARRADPNAPPPAIRSEADRQLSLGLIAAARRNPLRGRTPEQEESRRKAVELIEKRVADRAAAEAKSAGVEDLVG